MMSKFDVRVILVDTAFRKYKTRGRCVAVKPNGDRCKKRCITKNLRYCYNHL